MEFIDLPFSGRIALKRKCVRLQLVSIFYTQNRFLISVLILKSIHLQPHFNVATVKAYTQYISITLHSYTTLLRFQEDEAPIVTRQSAHEGGTIVSLMHRPSLPIFMAYVYVRNKVDPRAIVRPVGLCQ
jgi:hypothetical protein